MKREKESFCCFVTVCTTMSVEKRKKTRELSEEVRHKNVSSMDNPKEASPFPETSMFLYPPYAMLSGSLRPMALQLPDLDVAARENVIEDCSEGLFEWWRKHLDQLPNRFKLTFRNKVRQFQLTPSVGNSMKGFYGRRSRRTPLLREKD